MSDDSHIINININGYEYSVGEEVQAEFMNYMRKLIELNQHLDEAIARIEDMLAADEGQAFSEAEKFLRRVGRR